MGFLHLFFLIYLHLKACAPQALIIRFVLKTWNCTFAGQDNRQLRLNLESKKGVFRTAF
jgi:hypothetical protein